MEENKGFLRLTSFWLKVVALLTMTIDHIGYILTSSPINTIFRYIGRLAFPLFCFMIVEGVLHSKNLKKYFIRLAILLLAILLCIVLSDTIPFFKNNGFSMRDEGNIFIDLILGASAVTFLKSKKPYIKVLAILPLCYGIASFVASCLEYCGCNGKILWFPYFLRTQYGYLAVLLCIGFYFSYCLADKYLSFVLKLPSNSLKDSLIYRKTSNIFAVIFLFICNSIYCFVGMLLPPENVFFFIDIQFFAFISGAFILLYNGKRGYNAKWFQYGSYLYYPLHLALIYGIYELIMLIM